MTRIGRNRGIVQALQHRELLLVKSAYRANLKTLKSIALSEGTTYKEVWRIKKKTNIVYSDGRLFMEQYRKCYAICGRNALPTFTYDLECRDYGKIEDTLICCSPVSRPCFENAAMFKCFMLSLTSTNWMCNYNMDTGKLLESVYLGPPSRYNYKHLDWERQGETITVMTIKNPLRTNLQSKNTVLVVIAWFSVRPLRFKALLEFDRKVFGKDCAHCNVSEGLLIVGTGNSTTGHVLLYDFYQVVKEGRLFQCDIGQSCSALDDQALGSFPAGIPLNCKVKEPPPVLFRVQCSEYTLHFGCFPFHCVFSIPKDAETFQISDVAHQKMVENGRISIPNTSFDKCHVSFHADDSGRIIHYSNTAVRFFKLLEGPSGTKTLQETFKIDLMEQVATPGDPKRPASSRPARQATKRVNLDFTSECDRTFLCDDYENEIDIYAVLLVPPSLEKQNIMVDLYDNRTDKKIKSVDTGVQYDEFSEYDLILDLEIMLIIEKTSLHHFACYMFQIHEPGAEMKTKRARVKNKR